MKNEVRIAHDRKILAEAAVMKHAFDEMIAFMNCIHYEYDRDACEESCTDISQVRTADFDARLECWICPRYYPKEVKKT